MKNKEREKPAALPGAGRHGAAKHPEGQNGLILYQDRLEHRKKIRQGKKRRKIALVAVLFAVILLYLNWDVLSPTVIGGTIGDFFDQMGKSKYPVTLSQGNFVSAVPLGNNLGVLTDTAFLVYSASGSLYAERPHGMTTPAAQSSGSWAILYDRGG